MFLYDCVVELVDNSNFVVHRTESCKVILAFHSMHRPEIVKLREKYSLFFYCLLINLDRLNVIFTWCQKRDFIAIAELRIENLATS